MPFLVIILSGIVIYLGSIIGRFTSERNSIELLMRASEPKGVFAIPAEVEAKKWQTFSFALGGVYFKYPGNWRLLQNEDLGIIREGEDAIISTDALDARINGESMVAYRVARLAALQDLKFPVEFIEEAEIADKKALVLKYKSTADGNIFYETTFLDRGFFYTIVLGIKNFKTDTGVNAIVEEYRDMLATISVKKI